MAITVGRGRLIPDQLFALQYPDGYRAFMLEIDCGTEPFESSAARKSLGQSLQLYRDVLRNGEAGRQYGLKAPVFSWWLFGDLSRAQKFQEQRSKLPDRSDQMIHFDIVDLLAHPAALTQNLAATGPLRERW